MASYGGPDGGNYYHPQQQMPIHQHHQYNQPRRGPTSEVVYYDYDYATSNNPSQAQPRQPVQEDHQMNNAHYQPGFGYNHNQPPPNFQQAQGPLPPQIPPQMYHTGPEYQHASDRNDPHQGMYHVQAPPPSMERGYHHPMAPPRVAPAEYNDQTNNEKTGRDTYEMYLSSASGPRIQKTILNDQQQQERLPEFVNNSNYKPPSTSGNYNSGGLMDSRAEPRMSNSQESTYYNRPASENVRCTLEARPDPRPPSTQQDGNGMYYKSSSGTNNFNSESRIEPKASNARPEDVYYNNKIGLKQDCIGEVSSNLKNYTEPVPGIRRGGEPGRLNHKEDNKMKIFMGVVTQIQDSFGMIGDDVFFQKSCVKGPCPKLGDRVLVEAEAVEAMPFKWNSKRVQIVNQDLEVNNRGSLQKPEEGAFTRREGMMQKSAPPPPSISTVSGVLKHSQSLPSVGQLKSILKTSNSVARNPPPPPVISKNISTRHYHGKSITNTEKYRPDTPEPVDFRSKPFFNEPSVFIQKSAPVSSRGTVNDYSGFEAYQSFSHNAAVAMNPHPLTGRVQDPFDSTMMTGPYHSGIPENNIPYRRISSEMIQSTKAPPANRRSVSPFSRRQSRSPIPRRHSRSPIPLPRRHSRSPIPLARRHSRSPLSKRRSKSPLSRRRSKSPLSRRRSISPLSRRRSKSPLARRRSRSPLARRRSRSPLPRRRSRSPLPRRRSRSPLPKRRSRSPLSRRRSKSQSPNSTGRKSEGMKRTAPPEKRIAPPEKRIAPPETRTAPPEGDLSKSSTSSKKLELKVSSVDSSKYEAPKSTYNVFHQTQSQQSIPGPIFPIHPGTTPYLPNPVYNNKSSSLSSMPTVLPNPLHTTNATNRSDVINVSEGSSRATNSSIKPPPPSTDIKSLKSKPVTVKPVNEVIKQQMVVNPMKKIGVSASASLTHTTPNVPGKSITTPVVNSTASTMSGNAKQKAKTKAEQAPAYVVKYEKPETAVASTSKTQKPLIDTQKLSASVDKALSELRKKFETDKPLTTSKKENTESAVQNVKVDAVTPKEKKVITKSLPEIEIVESDSDNNEDVVDPQHKKFLEEEQRLVQKEDWDAVDKLREDEDQRLRMKEEYRLRDLRSQESKLIRSGAPKEEIDRFRKANGTFEKRWAEEQRLIKIREEEENRKRDFEPRSKEEDSATRWQRRLMMEKEKEKRREEYRQRMRLHKESTERTRERLSSPVKSTRPPIEHRSRRSRSRSLVFRRRRSRSGSPHRSRGSRSGSGHRHRRTSRSRERSPFFQDRTRRVSESPPRHQGPRSRRVSYDDYRRSRMNRSSRSLSRELEYEEFVERHVHSVSPNDRVQEDYHGEEDEEIALQRAMEMVRRKQQELDMREREIDALMGTSSRISHEARVHNYDKGYRDHPKDDRIRRY